MEVKTFSFQGITIRTVEIEGEPWFVGSDVLTVLYGKASGMGKAYGPLAADERTKVDRIRLGMHPGRPAELISESGLYKLIMRSDKDEAKVFQDWVTREVLPAIRKTGGYLLNEEARETAHADDRAAMPVPEVFAQAFRKIGWGAI